MTDFTKDENFEILVEFPSTPGRRQVARKPKEAAQESARALNNSMSTIQHMAQRFTSTMNSLGSLRPDEMELKFGIKFNTEFGAIISKAGLEANLNVKLVWKNEPEEEIAYET